MGKRGEKRLDQSLIGLIFLVMTLFIWITWKANSDLAFSRVVLPMDEGLSFGDVRSMLSAVTYREFFERVIVGDVQRYGRSFFNLIALVNVLLGGTVSDEAQIIITRMLQVLLILGSFILLIYRDLKKPLTQLICLLFLISLPMTTVYAVMPKPEPLQLFLLVLFWIFFQENRFRLGRSFWLLGFAMGTKISTLPIAILAFAIALWHRPTQQKPKVLAKELSLSVLLFLSGWICAVPMLGMVPFKPSYWHWYLSQTFLNTGHESDSQAVNFVSWIKMLFTQDYGRVLLFLILLYVILEGAIIYDWYRHRKKRRSEVLHGSLLLMSLGLALGLAIMVGTKRLWYTYLFVPQVFMLVGFFRISETLPKKWQYCVFAISLVPLWGMSHTAIRSYSEFAHRSESEEHRQKWAAYNFANGYLKLLSQKNHKQLAVKWDAHMYPADSSPTFKPTPYWNVYTDWTDASVDVVVLTLGNTYYLWGAHPENIIHEKWVESLAMEAQHTVLQATDGKRAPASSRLCKAKPCYRKFPYTPYGLIFYVKDTLKPLPWRG